MLGAVETLAHAVLREIRDATGPGLALIASSGLIYVQVVTKGFALLVRPGNMRLISSLQRRHTRPASPWRVYGHGRMFQVMLAAAAIRRLR